MALQRRRLIKLLLGLALLGFGAAAVAWVQHALADRPPGFAWNSPALSQADYLALAARTGWKAVEVPVGAPGGLALRGLVRPPRGEGVPWVLFFQGNSQRLLAEGQEFLEAVAGAEDLGLAVVAWRGYDGSPGRPSRDALVSDAAATVRWLRANEALGGPLHLVAFSLGTLPAVATAVDLKRAPPGQRPTSLTLLAPYTALRMFEPGLISRYLAGEPFDVRPFLGRVEVPTLVVHGELDQVLPVAMGRVVSERIGGGARLLILPGAGHLDLLADPRTHRAVLEMVRSHP